MKRRLVDETSPSSYLQQQEPYDPCKRSFVAWDAAAAAGDDDDDEGMCSIEEQAPHSLNGFSYHHTEQKQQQQQEEPLVFIDLEGPPPAVLLVDAIDMTRIWTPLRSASRNQQVHCMFCKTGMIRNKWPDHMKHKHEQAMRVCPFAYCAKESTTAQEGREHILKYHDVRGYRCRDCPDLIFDRRATQWKHQCQTHLNWAPNDFHVDIGEEPLHEDDPGGTRGERIFYDDHYYDDDEDDEDEGSGRGRNHQSPFSRGGAGAASVGGGVGGVGPSCGTPNAGRVGSSKLGSCISGLVPW